MESRIQGSRPRPRTQKKIRGQSQGQLLRGQTLSRPRTGISRGQGQEPRTQTQVFSKNKKNKKGPQKIFLAIFKKKFFRCSPEKFFRCSPKRGLAKTFSNDQQNSTIQKIALFLSRGLSNFRGLKASTPRPRTPKCVLEAKDVLEDSTSDNCKSKIYP